MPEETIDEKLDEILTLLRTIVVQTQPVTFDPVENARSAADRAKELQGAG